MRARAMSPVGVAVIGAGPWGDTLARAFARIGDAELRWICDLDQERRARAGAAHPRASVTAAVDDVLGDPAVEAAVVAVDSPRHHSVGLRVLAANRHLLIEKPMALSVADAAALRDEASLRDRVLTVGHLLLHHPAVRRARELVASGAIGEPLHFEAVRTAPGTARRRGSAWWTLAPHDVSLALHLLGGVPATVSAVATAGAGGGDDVAAFATLRFADGRLAHVHAARLAAVKERRFSIVGTRRSLIFDELDAAAPLRLGESPAARPPGPPEEVPIDAGDALLAQCRHFLSCVARGDTGGGNGAHALAVVGVLEAGARSMRAGGAPIEVA
jgi:predicted dehydrogenase